MGGMGAMGVMGFIKSSRFFLIVALWLSLAACGESNGDSNESSNGVLAGPDQSGMPVPRAGTVPQPIGVPGNLQVLNWAGFQSAVSYTFDDGQPSQIEHYEELNAPGVPMTFFLSTYNSEFENFDTVFSKAVEDGHELGNHTHHHCMNNSSKCAFGDTIPADLTADIVMCSDYISANLGQSETATFAAPYGDGGWQFMAKDFFFLNRHVNDGTVAPLTGNPFTLPSYMADTGETAVEDFNPKIASANDLGEWQIFTFHGISPTSEKWYPLVDISEIAASIQFAKAARSIWIDTMKNVGAYWRAQIMFSELTPQTSAGVTTWQWTLPDHFPTGKFLRVTVDGGTLSQKETVLNWSPHGYYEVNLDAGELTLRP